MNRNPVDRPSPVALLLIDVINDLDFPGSDALVRSAIPMARRLADFKRRAAAAGIPAIYINDNFGRWRSDFRSLVDHCTRDDAPGREVASCVVSNTVEDNDYALRQMSTVLKADTTPSHRLDVADLMRRHGASRTVDLASRQ